MRPARCCGPCARPWACRSTRPCCPGRPGRATATGCGGRTGTTACGGRPGSAATGRPPGRCRRTWPAWPGSAARTMSGCGLPGCGRPSTGEKAMLQEYDERNRDLIVGVAGRLVLRDQAGISPFDSAVQGGDAVWEGLRLYRGKIFRLAEHLARLRRSATALGFAAIPPDEEITGQIAAVLQANQMTDDVHIRLTLSRGVKITSGMDPRLNQSGPTLIVLAEHKPPVYDPAGITLITASVRRPPPDCLDPKIHHANLLGSILAKIEANVAGAADAVMLDQRGFVAETNATHLFLVSGGRLATPSTAACPEGITRAAVLELAAAAGIGCTVGDLSLAQFYAADEVFATGTMGGLTPVTAIDGRVIGGGSAGPVTLRLSALFADPTTRSGTPVV